MAQQVTGLGFGVALFTTLLVAGCGGKTADERSSPNPVNSGPDVSAEPSGETDAAGDSTAASEASSELADTGSRSIPGLVLIEDGEDSDARILQDETSGWDGYWYTYDDKFECTNMTPELGVTNPSPLGFEFTMSEYAATGFSPAPLEGEQSNNLYGVRIWGGGHTVAAAGGFGAGLGFVLNNTAGFRAYDLLAQGFVGIRFQVRSAFENQQVAVKIKDAWSAPDAGNCIPRDTAICGPEGCHDDPLVSIVATQEWTTQTILFSDFARAGWSSNYTTPPPDNLLHADVAYQVQFEIASTAMFDLWFDNIGFVLGDGTAVPVNGR